MPYPAYSYNPKFREYVNRAAFPVSAPTGYYALDVSTGMIYTYDGSAWVLVSDAYDVPVDPSVSVGDAVYWDSTAGALKPAQADVSGTAGVIGVVTAIDGGNATLLGSGAQATVFAGLTPAATYYLSAATAGQVTAVKPSTVGWVEVGTAVDAITIELFIQSFGLFPDE